MDLALLLEWAIKSIILIFIVIGGFAYVTLFERRALARIQVRIGPNRAGPWGILQPMADGIKLIFKEELIPDRADKIVFVLAPVLTVVPALILLAVIPFGTSISLFGRTISLSLAGDVNVGVLYIMAIASIAVYGIALAGWSSNNKYALMGGLRATAQMISYELVLALSFIGPILLANSMSLNKIVEAQNPIWYIIFQPIGFLLFFIAAIAEINRSPFDMPEAEQELTAGYHAEYSGMKFALFFMAEYGKMIVVSFIAATLFLGGYLGPFVDRFTWLGPIYLGIKVVVLIFLMVWIRATLPRIRYDRLMALGWKVLLPVALANVVITAMLIVLVGGF
ncbi:MAG: NADH-quinone oxidoreductase subunit NuoH [Anaerolineales bacterium]|jgi:NADH-quinone oxidoreductase subunit H|nr:NADH-quinone oxidoreductase subunit NuoH [Anaerolineales bacterium]